MWKTDASQALCCQLHYPPQSSGLSIDSEASAPGSWPYRQSYKDMAGMSRYRKWLKWAQVCRCWIRKFIKIMRFGWSRGKRICKTWNKWMCLMPFVKHRGVKVVRFDQSGFWLERISFPNRKQDLKPQNVQEIKKLWAGRSQVNPTEQLWESAHHMVHA